MAAAARESSTPPPVIGKLGRYTVFMTPPPSTPDPSAQVVSPPPVQPPPHQFQKIPSTKSAVPGVGFLWNALDKVQHAHSSLDDYLADWFGLNQSKYQWALNDYLESKEMDKTSGKSKDLGNKV